MAWWEPYIPKGEPNGLELVFYLVICAIGIIGLSVATAALLGVI